MKTTVVKDEKFENMYRVRWEDGVLSENFYNLTRASEFSKKLNSGIENPTIPHNMK